MAAGSRRALDRGHNGADEHLPWHPRRRLGYGILNGYSVSKVQYYSTTSNSFTFTTKVSGVIIAQVWVCKTYGAWGGEIGLHIDVPSGLKEEASVSTAIAGNDGVHRSMTAKVVLSGAVAGKSYDFSSSLDPNSGYDLSTPRAWMLEVRPY